MNHLGDLAAALVDGELTHDVRDRALAHLAACARCRDEVEAQRRLKSLLGDLPEVQPSAAMVARLLAVGGAPPPGSDGPPPRVLPLGRPGTRARPLQPARAPGRGPATRRRAPRRAGPGRSRLRRALIGGTSVVLLGVGAFALGGGDPSPSLRPVDPSSTAYVVDHVATTGQVPLTDPAVGAVSVSYAR